MGLYSGRESYAAISVQASPGTPVAPDVYIPYTDIDWNSKPDRSYETEHRANTDKNHTPITPSVTTEGSITFPAYPAGGLEHAFYGVFGSYPEQQHSRTNYRNTRQHQQLGLHQWKLPHRNRCEL